MAVQENRIILDTNLWISFLLSKDYTKLDGLLAAQHVVILFSEELINEFISVAERPKFKKYFSLNDLHELLSVMKIQCVSIDVISVTDICRDPKDNFLLALAKDGNATHLLTGDKDLLDIATFNKTKIVTIAEYLKG
jgi:putative PIN family toxin of toxin-antitoxin system